MVEKRQIVIGLVAVGVVFVAYLLYNLLSGTPEIKIDQANVRTENIKIPEFDNESARIGNVTAGPVRRSKFIDRDEKTKEVERIFGYDELLNPEEHSNKWQLEKPYMEIYAQNPDGGAPILRCKITSDHGTAQMETVGGRPSPTSADLIGDVIIKIYPVAATDQTEATITLDDLEYNSQRSEFKTTGPFTIVSNRGQMEGRGLVLIYNTALGRLEYLKVFDLDYINYKRISSPSPDVAVEDVAKADAAEKPIAVVSQQAPDPQPPAPAAPAIADKDVADKKKTYYQCRFIENAKIEYGTKIVIDSATEIAIKNILWAGTSAEKEQPTAVTSARKPNSQADAPKPDVPDVVSLEPLAPDGTENNTGREDVVDVFIRCDGGMIIRPVPSEGSSDSSQMIEIAGKPVRVRQAGQTDDLAQCAMMRYNVDADILSMFTSDKEKYNRLRIARSDSTLRTTGTITWRRRANHAVINGPGILLFGAETKDDVAEMTFGSVMNLFFAKSTANQTDELILSSADLAGGMTAAMSRGSDSQARANSAKFLFDRQSNITVADLAGNVQLSSADGRLNSGRTKILFAKDTAGKVYAKTLQSSEDPVLQAAVAASVRDKDNDKDKDNAGSARLQATRIDYYISTVNAIATGPVEFKFYMSQDSQGSKPVPVVITAQEDARYFTSQNRVVFSGNVVGTSQTQKDGFGQTNRFYGGKLIVDLVETADGSEQMDVRHLKVTDGDVKLESRRIANGIKISHVGLMCEQIDYDAAEKLIVATGPGQIHMNNANMPTKKKKKRDKKPSYYDGPSYALIRNFDTLKWFIDKDRIVAAGKVKSVYMSYIPVLPNGKLGKKDEASVTHLVADFVENQTKQKELLKLTATEGIYYQQGKRGNWFLGEELFYDAATSLMTIHGSDRWPCMLNGAVADNVEYNLLTGRKKTSLSETPGAIGF